MVKECYHHNTSCRRCINPHDAEDCSIREAPTLATHHPSLRAQRDNEGVRYFRKCSEAKNSQGDSHKLMREDIIAGIILVDEWSDSVASCASFEEGTCHRYRNMFDSRNMLSLK